MPGENWDKYEVLECLQGEEFISKELNNWEDQIRKLSKQNNFGIKLLILISYELWFNDLHST